MGAPPELLKEGFGKVRDDGVFCGRHVVSRKGGVVLSIVKEEHSRLMGLCWGFHAGLYRYH